MSLRRLLRHAGRGLLIAALLALGGEGGRGSFYDWRLPAWAAPPPVPIDNPMSEAKVELGRRLFHDVRLSGSGYMKCATCHEPERGFSEARPTALGTTGMRHPRHAMPLANVGYFPTLTWADPSVRSLEQQALIPMFGEHPVEMMTFARVADVFELIDGGDDTYRRLFAQAFPEVGGRIDFQTIPKAIAAFERTLISRDAPWDRYRFGGDEHAISDAAKRGAGLFFGERLKCARCHGEPFFTDAVPVSQYHNTGLYNLDGRGGLPAGSQGLVDHTGRAEDMGRFRTPSLRNVEVAGPYMHDGSIATLAEVIAAYAAGGRAALDGNRSPLTSDLVGGFEISEGETADLIAFLDILTDWAFLENQRYRTPFR